MEVLDLGFVEKEDWGQEKEYTPLTPKNLFGLLATILVNPCASALGQIGCAASIMIRKWSSTDAT
jgi:hypothetical protein